MALHEWVRPSRDIDSEEVAWVVAFVLAVNVCGIVPGILGTPDAAWFASLDKPALFPPTWVFGVVWTILFTAMGVAAFLVFREGTDLRSVQVALGMFGLQLLVNMSWSPTFFALQRPLAALGIIAVLDVLVAVTIVAFARVERLAATLLVPYLLWALFATLLNYQFWALN